MPTDPTLSYDDLKTAVAGSAAAFRLTLKLEAVSPKVFPPTYEGGKYATEDRNIGGQKVPCVLLDSVPSQANRMELALQDASDGGLIQLPVVSVDFTAVDNPGIPKITSAPSPAPHRRRHPARQPIGGGASRPSSANRTSARNSTSSPPGTPRRCFSTPRTASCSACGTAPGRAAGWA